MIFLGSHRFFLLKFSYSKTFSPQVVLCPPHWPTRCPFYVPTRYSSCVLPTCPYHVPTMSLLFAPHVPFSSPLHIPHAVSSTCPFHVLPPPTIPYHPSGPIGHRIVVIEVVTSCLCPWYPFQQSSQPDCVPNDACVCPRAIHSNIGHFPLTI